MTPDEPFEPRGCLRRLVDRAVLSDRLEHAIARAARQPSRLAVLCVGFDTFSQGAADFGYGVDERLVAALAPRLAHELRPGDTLGRLDDEVLVVLCEGLAEETGAISLAERILRSMVEPVTAGGRAHLVVASIGIVIVAGTSATAAQVLHDAAAAMHLAKSRGGNRYQIHNAQLRERLLARVEAEREVREAIDREQLRLHYQPLVALADEKLVGAEALVRWQHPERGLLLPNEFVPLAEESDAILPLGRWVIERAFRDCAAWQGTFPELTVSVSLNLSARQVAQAGIPRVVREAIEQTGVNPARIQLEITESALLERGESPAETLAALKQLGVQLVLDDFGTGYSSLSYLKRFPIDAVKIDRSFIAGLGSSRADAAIVAGIVAIARALDIAVVAEGVESAAQAQRLRELGCPYAQGYHFGRPIAAEAFSELLSATAPRTRL
jgi:diguanylate cyclase (GGDEF)-like protein